MTNENLPSEPNGYVQSIPSHPNVTRSIERVVRCLRDCDLEAVVEQAKVHGTAKELEATLNEMQKWLESNGIQRFPYQTCRRVERTYIISQTVVDALIQLDWMIRYRGAIRLFSDAGESHQEAHSAVEQLEEWLARHGFSYYASADDNEYFGQCPTLAEPDETFE